VLRTRPESPDSDSLSSKSFANRVERNQNPSTMYRPGDCKAHLATRWFASSVARLHYFQRHTTTIQLLIQYSSHDVAAKHDFDVEVHHVLSEVSRANDDIVSLVAVINRLENKLEVRHIIDLSRSLIHHLFCSL
jgi:hypothetical protein